VAFLKREIGAARTRAALAVNRPKDEIGQQAVGQLPWGHNVILLQKLDDPAARLWYAENAVEHGYRSEIGQRKLLEHHVATGRYEREGRALTNFSGPARGFSRRNLFYMRRFAALWPDLERVPSVMAQIGWTAHRVLLDEFGYGDVWTWTAICADTKLVPAWLVGERTTEDGLAFMYDLKGRMRDRIQLSTDGHQAYRGSVPYAFDADEVDWTQLHKSEIAKHLLGSPFFRRLARALTPRRARPSLRRLLVSRKSVPAIDPQAHRLLVREYAGEADAVAAILGRRPAWRNFAED
jgi:hypothetical protein